MSAEIETVLITGASSGIGQELARLFGAEGSRLVLVARREDRLRSLAEELQNQHKTESLVLPIDLADPGAPQAIFDRITAAGVEIDVLINNAGLGALGLFWRGAPENHAEMVQVNVNALTQLTRLILPGMLKREKGAVLNISSTAAFQPGPNMAIYYASKAYVLSLSEALRYELRRTPVRVTCLCPGATRTEFGVRSGMERTLMFRFAMPVERVARAGYRGMRRGKGVIVPGLFHKLGAIGGSWLPRFVVMPFVAAIQRTPHEK